MWIYKTTMWIRTIYLWYENCYSFFFLFTNIQYIRIVWLIIVISTLHQIYLRCQQNPLMIIYIYINKIRVVRLSLDDKSWIYNMYLYWSIFVCFYHRKGKFNLALVLTVIQLTYVHGREPVQITLIIQDGGRLFMFFYSDK